MKKHILLGLIYGLIAATLAVAAAAHAASQFAAVVVGVHGGAPPDRDNGRPNWFLKPADTRAGWCAGDAESMPLTFTFSPPVALDTFGVHAVGGTMGAFLTGCLARNSANPNLVTNLKAYVTDQFFQPLVGQQLIAIAVTICLAVIGTAVIASIVKATVGLRVDEEVETLGLDLAEHGEEGYHGA